MSKYISFHNHSCIGSLLDSTLKIKDLVSWAKANNMQSVGLQDHGNLTACLKLINECKKQEIKPIIGFEAYVTENKLDQDGKKIRDNYHIGLIAKNKNGWKNLVKLHNLSWKNNRYFYDPRITLKDLFKYKQDLIVTSACIGGVLGRPFLNGDMDTAEATLILLKNEFGDDFYLELQDHNSFNKEDQQKQVDYNYWLIKMSKKHGVKLIVQQDAHYYLPEDWEGHQILLCKNTGSKLSNPKFTFDSHEYYLKNETEMLETFNSYPLQVIQDCFKNTTDIANKVEQFDISNTVYDCPTFGTKEEGLAKLKLLTKQGLLKRFSKDFLDNHPEYIKRVKYELSVVESLNFIDYFLMLVDLYDFANKNNIYMGLARGSCAGSLVLYCLGVTQVDPMRYNLLFERFLHSQRVSMCDVDIDINDKYRPKIIQYLKDRYGEDHVCNIGTYGEMTAKASFKAVASALEIPFDKANRISGIIDSNMTLKENYEQNDLFRSACQTDELVNRAYKLSLSVEGTFSQRGTHACGMVISSKPLDEVCPCVTVKDPKTGIRISATTNEMKEIDGDFKLLKLDCLGLKTVSIIQDTDELIKQRGKKCPDYKNLDIHDEKTYKMLSEGQTSMVFQFSSPLMQRFLKQIKPKCIEDLSAITSIARPGCLDSGLAEMYVRRATGQEPVIPFVEGMEEYMKDSLQLPLYQENCMQLSRVVAGFSGSEADTLRKCIGKKDPEKLKKERTHFVTGAIQNGFTEDKANEIFDIIEKFGGYGFNKSHAVGYSLLSYATAYYKANYTIEFITAVLNSVQDDIEKINLYINEAYRLGISILPPDINESNENFTITENGEIRFGLNAIKGLGKVAVSQIIKSRKNKKYSSLVDLIDRTTKVDKSSIQALLRVGALNNIEKYPKRWDKMLDYLNEAKNSKVYEETLDLEKSIYTIVGTKQAKKSNKYTELIEEKRSLKSSRLDKIKKEQIIEQQNNIVETYIEAVEKHFLQYLKYTPKERIQFEQELLGFNITTNPYKRWNDFKRFFISKQGNKGIDYIEMNELLENGEKYYDLEKFHTVGVLSNIKELKTKKGQKMAKLTVEYYGAKTIITVFANKYENDVEFKLQKGNMVSIVGTLVETNKQYTDDDYEIRLESIRQLNVLVNEDNKCIIDITNKDRNKIDFIVKNFANNERKNNMSIEKCVMYKINGKYLILNGLCWVNNPNKLKEELIS